MATEYTENDGPNVLGVQWRRGTTTIDQVRVVAPEAFTRDGELYLPSASDVRHNDLVWDTQYVYKAVGTDDAMVMYANIFESKYTAVP